MVKKVDTNQFGNFSEAAGNLEVGVAGFEGAGGVVVGDDDPGSPVGDGIGEDFAGVNQ